MSPGTVLHCFFFLIKTSNFGAEAERSYRAWGVAGHIESEGGLYSAANDPRPQMIPRPEMIAKLDRK